MLIVWKIENFDGHQLPYILISLTKVLLPLPTYQCLQKSVLDFSYFV